MKKTRMAIATAFLFLSVSAQAALQGTMYKNPDCDCCEKHTAHLKANGINVNMIAHPDLASFKKARGIPELLGGCHTILIGGYIVEGHVPASAIKKMLAQKPKIKGISVPGMPANSPGMESGVMKPSNLNVYAISSGAPKVWSVERMPGGNFGTTNHQH